MIAVTIIIVFVNTFLFEGQDDSEGLQFLNEASVCRPAEVLGW